MDKDNDNGFESLLDSSSVLVAKSNDRCATSSACDCYRCDGCDCNCNYERD